MNQHTPTETEPGVYRCQCGFHAVATQQGMHVIESGAGRQLHLVAIAERQIETRAMVEAQIKRLIERYWAGGDIIVTMRQVRTYGKYIKAEHGL